MYQSKTSRPFFYLMRTVCMPRTWDVAKRKQNQVYTMVVGRVHARRWSIQWWAIMDPGRCLMMRRNEKIRERKIHGSAIHKSRAETWLSSHILMRRGSRTTREHGLQGLVIPPLPHPVHLLCPSCHLQLLPTNEPR